MRRRDRLAQVILGWLLKIHPDLLADRDAALARAVVVAVLEGNGLTMCRACAQRVGLVRQNGEWVCAAHRTTEA